MKSAEHGAHPRACLQRLRLLEADDAQLRWTAGRMRAAGVRYLLGAHCTGLEAVYRLRALAGLTRQTAVVGAVASSYTDDRGLSPGWLPR